MTQQSNDLTPHDPALPPPEGTENPHASNQMRAQLDEMLATYPPNYQAALRALDEIAEIGAGPWECRGAMETGLDEHGMEVTFDFHRDQPFGRTLVMVTMNRGTVTRVQYRSLAEGEASGIHGL